MALSMWPLPCLAAVNSGDDLVLGELEGGGRCPDSLMIWGRLRSVAEELKAC